MLRASPRTAPVSTFLSLREISHEMFSLAVPVKPMEREYQAVIAVSPLGFSLMKEEEQEAILEGFRRFLARLTFDVDIHISIEPYNLRPYLDQLSKAAHEDGLSEIAQDHQQFVRTLASGRALLQRGFHLHVPAEVASTSRGRGKHMGQL